LAECVIGGDAGCAGAARLVLLAWSAATAPAGAVAAAAGPATPLLANAPGPAVRDPPATPAPPPAPPPAAGPAPPPTVAPAPPATCALPAEAVDPSLVSTSFLASNSGLTGRMAASAWLLCLSCLRKE